MAFYRSKYYQEDLDYLVDFVKPVEKKYNILITGASGLLGSLLADAFMKYNMHYGHRIHVYCLGRSIQKLEKRFTNWLHDSNMHLLEGDIRTFCLEDYEFDGIIHAASNADPYSYVTRPVSTITTNIVGTENVLNYCKNHLSVRMVYISTSEVYGEVEGTDVYTEEMSGKIDFTRIRSCYPESKRTAELLIRGYNEEYGTLSVIARLSSVYGLTMLINDSKAHAQFIHNGLHHQDIILKSSGKQKRNYCYGTDAAAAVLFLLFSGTVGETYNVANKAAVASIAEVAETIASLCGQKVIFHQPDPVDLKGFSIPKDCILNTEKIENLGWKGKYSIQEGFERTIRILKEI